MSGEELGAGPTVQGSQGVQIGNNNKQFNTFVQTYIQELHLPPAPEPGPRVVGEVPRQAPAFQARDELMTRLAESGPGVTVVRAVTGMRGVGKSQLAAAYARACIDEGWRLVAWIDAAQSATVLNGLANVAAALGIGEPGAELESLAEAVRNRLEAQGDQCLVVFDNAADIDTLMPYVPAAGRCRVIITSNQQESGSLGEAVPVGVFTEREALLFLARRSAQSDEDGARRLAGELGFLPLALAQAAAVITSQHLSYSTYLARLSAVPVRDLLKRTAGEPYPHGSAEAIVLALSAAEDEDQTGLCRGLMSTISLLSPAGVSRALLHAADEEGLLRPRKFLRRSHTAGPDVVDEALGQMADTSLLSFSVDGGTVSAHRLTMRVAVERQAQNASLVPSGAGVTVLLAKVTQSLPEPWRNRPAARDVIQQIISLHEHLAPYLGKRDTALAQALLRLRGWTVWCMNELGDTPARAAEYGQVVVADCERMMGDTHMDTIGARLNLAGSYRAAGWLDEAIALYERTLVDVRRLLGETHPHTLNIRNNLAGAYKAAGRLDEAIALYERTLTDYEKVLGDTHPYTLAGRNNLAAAYQDAGQVNKAIPLLERTLADRVQTLGDTHPSTLVSRSNLARAYQGTGKIDEAIALHRRTYEDATHVLGEDHPSTLNFALNLAADQQQAGSLDEAIPLYERVLAGTEGTLGRLHPNTLTARSTLASAYQDAGRLAEAISLHERSLADAEQFFGDTDLSTLALRGILAEAYQAAGRPTEAEALRKHL